MENKLNKTLTVAGTVIIALLITGLVFTTVSYSKGKKSLNSERLASEKNLSEKLSFEKELTKLKADFSALRNERDANLKSLSESNARISENEKKLRSILAENRSLKASRKELEEMKMYKSDIEKESARLKSDNDKLMSQNKDLQNSLSRMETEKNKLAVQLAKAQMNNADNYLLTATRGKKNERIVVSASRAKKLNMVFEVPQGLTETMSFRIETPSGSIISPDDKRIAWYFPEDTRNLTASLSPVTGEFEQSRQVVLNYTSNAKLAKGEYKIQILCDGKNIGNCRIMLR